MRLGLLTLVLIASLFGSGYWYTALALPCKVPVQYTIGTIDPGFNIEKDKVVEAALKAEAIWEKELNAELFVYNETDGLPIDLVFDERQENADLEEDLREDLEAKEGMSESVSQQYEELISEFRKLKRDYESRIVAYERKLSVYNSTVTEWNSKGGAPDSEIEKLSATQESLIREKEDLESTAVKLNSLAGQLNAIGARGNSLITDYNTIVNEYNDRFAESEEFAQGDYTSDAISVYQFNSKDELVIVLAHEFGHSLSLDHVEDEKSIMYHFMGAQLIQGGLSEEDIAEFNRVCTDSGFAVKVLRFFAGLV